MRWAALSPRVIGWVVVSALLGPAAATAQLAVPPIGTFGPGRYAVGSADWNFGTIDITKPGSTTETITVEHFGTLRYPAQAVGTSRGPIPDAPVAQGGPFPFVVFSHGRFQEDPYIGHNHEQASYLLDQLASWGFVVASVNLDVVGQYGQPAAIKQRGEIVLATIAAFEQLDPTLYDIDFQHIGLVGHSRGGEGCLAAWKGNTAGYAIRAIATISLTNFQNMSVTGVPYLGLYGSKDGDVNNGWPIQVYDQAEPAPKLFEYIEGANHFWFTDSISYGGEGAALITREQHHDVARTYITAFLLRELRGAPLPEAELCDGKSLTPVTGPIRIHPLFADPQRLLVNSFEEPDADPGHNSLGGTSVGEALVTQAEEDLDNVAKTFYQRTHGGWIAFDSSGGLPAGAAAPVYVEELPGGVDASPYTHLSLNALQRWNAPLNAANQAQDLHVMLVDGAGHSAQVALSDWGTIPWPITHGGAFPKKSVLRTTRIPLREFSEVNPAIDMTDLRLVSLVFDQTPSAELRIDDLSFTR
jgi:dienelactone hydrolase